MTCKTCGGRGFIVEGERVKEDGKERIVNPQLKPCPDCHPYKVELNRKG